MVSWTKTGGFRGKSPYSSNCWTFIRMCGDEAIKFAKRPKLCSGLPPLILKVEKRSMRQRVSHDRDTNAQERRVGLSVCTWCKIVSTSSNGRTRGIRMLPTFAVVKIQSSSVGSLRKCKRRCYKIRSPRGFINVNIAGGPITETCQDGLGLKPFLHYS